MLFFFNDTATTEIYTLSLHDALPISFEHAPSCRSAGSAATFFERALHLPCVTAQGIIGIEAVELEEGRDRKSTRLNSSHSQISYAVFCLKKKKQTEPTRKTNSCTIS